MLPQLSTIYDHTGIPDYVTIITLSGVITKDDVKAYEKDIYTNLDVFEKIGLVIDMTDVSDMTEDALAEDLQFEMKLFTKLNRFPKVAIISDKKFIKAIVKYLNPIIPFMEIKVFAPDQPEDAVSFASDISIIKANTNT